MTGWQELKDMLNKEKKVSISEIFCSIKVHGNTRELYLRYLMDAGFIRRTMELPDQQYMIPESYYILILKIPEKMTLHEVVELSKNPWMTWFKYPELMERK